MNRSFALLASVGLLAASLLADGFIIVHPPGPLPPPVIPGPRPPRPVPPPPRSFSFAPLEVSFHRVEARIRDQVATTSVDQEFVNPNDAQLEGTYLFPIPAGARLDKFSMEVNGQPMDAELLAADQARSIYEDIVRRHRDPALLEYVGRDLLKVRIFPIEPRGRKRVKLSYTQLLKADGGLVNYVYPLNTERFAARPIPSVSLRVTLETTRPLTTIYSSSHAVEVRRDGARAATIGFEGKDLRPETDFQLFFASERDELGVNLLAERAAGEEGYFLLFAAPVLDPADTDRKPLPKDVTFVLDTSGSMAGAKIEQAKRALRFCVENLNDIDRFEVIRFATEIEPLFGRLVEAAATNRSRADSFIQGLKPLGGTAIHDALQRALGARPGAGDRPYYVIFLTDGLPTVGSVDNDAILRMVEKSGGATTRVFCFGIGNDVNTHLLDRITATTRAASAYVLPTEDLEVKLSSFFAKIKEPVLANPTLMVPDGVRLTRLHPGTLPDLFRGDQLILAGRYAGEGDVKITLSGSVNGATRSFVFPVKFPATASGHEFVPRLWATRRIGYLLDEIRLRGENAELRDEVVGLARQHGIVTPYTAYLIHEDEQRRGVPMTRRSLPEFETDRARQLATAQAYRSYQRDASGAAAVAAARYGLAQKSANQVGESLRLAQVEAGRAMEAVTPGSGPAMASAPVGAAGANVGKGGTDTEQTRFVGGRSFFRNGAQWIDTRVQSMKNPKVTRVAFNSDAYFDLLKQHPEAGAWLALGPQVQFVLGETVYETYE